MSSCMEVFRIVCSDRRGDVRVGVCECMVVGGGIGVCWSWVTAVWKDDVLSSEAVESPKNDCAAEELICVRNESEKIVVGIDFRICDAP